MNQTQDSHDAIALQVIMYLAAIALFGMGFYTMMTYGDGSEFSSGGMTGHIVGGDAYNYIIIALRGLGYMLAGLACVIIGAVGSIARAIGKAGARASTGTTTVNSDQPEEAKAG